MKSIIGFALLLVLLQQSMLCNAEESGYGKAYNILTIQLMKQTSYYIPQEGREDCGDGPSEMPEINPMTACDGRQNDGHLYLCISQMFNLEKDKSMNRSLKRIFTQEERKNFIKLRDQKPINPDKYLYVEGECKQRWFPKGYKSFGTYLNNSGLELMYTNNYMTDSGYEKLNILYRNQKVKLATGFFKPSNGKNCQRKPKKIFADPFNNACKMFGLETSLKAGNAPICVSRQSKLKKGEPLKEDMTDDMYRKMTPPFDKGQYEFVDGLCDVIWQPLTDKIKVEFGYKDNNLNQLENVYPEY